jgi:3-oxoacyl-[acyl-carrier-protein] synthase-3
MKIVDNVVLVAQNKVKIADLLMSAGRAEKEVSRTIKFTGIEHIRTVNNIGLTKFITNGLTIVQNKYPSMLQDIDAVIVISQTYDIITPSISTQIQKLFQMPETTFCIDVMDGCAGLIKGISLAEMLFAQGRSNILIIAGDINSETTAQSDLGTRILFGDGVSIMRVVPGGIEAKTHLINDGDLDGFIRSDRTKMTMNGFEVLIFTKNRVPSTITSFLNENCMRLEDFDAVILHQASKIIVENVAKLIGYKNTESSDFNCGDIGNLGAGSIGAWLANLGSDVEQREMRMLLAGFGAGLSVGVSAVSVQMDNNRIEYVAG